MINYVVNYVGSYGGKWELDLVNRSWALLRFALSCGQVCVHGVGIGTLLWKMFGRSAAGDHTSPVMSSADRRGSERQDVGSSSPHELCANQNSRQSHGVTVDRNGVKRVG